MTNIQKNDETILSLAFKPLDKKELIINILKDAVIAERLAKQIANLFNIACPSYAEKSTVPFETCYSGIQNAYVLLGICDYTELDSMLERNFQERVNNNVKDCDEVAKSIFTDWTMIINDFFSEKLKQSA